MLTSSKEVPTLERTNSLFIPDPSTEIGHIQLHYFFFFVFCLSGLFCSATSQPLPKPLTSAAQPFEANSVRGLLGCSCLDWMASSTRASCFEIKFSHRGRALSFREKYELCPRDCPQICGISGTQLLSLWEQEQRRVRDEVPSASTPTPEWILAWVQTVLG